MRVPISYRLANGIYNLGFYIAKGILPKARKRYQGIFTSFEKLEQFNAQHGEAKRVWFHASSVGEYEQCLPVLLAIKNRLPDHKIVLTLYSPSLYDYLGKNNRASSLDLYLYLPRDTAKNAITMTKQINPEYVIWSKYDFWFHHLKGIRDKGIPFYLVSAIFRSNQVFFKTAFGSWAKMLSCFSHIFLQDSRSAELLKTKGLTHHTVVGDTRLDRVIQRKTDSPEMKEVQQFKGSDEMIVLASVHPSDMPIIERVVGNPRYEKILIVPHDLNSSFLDKLSSFPNSESYSKGAIKASDRILILDTIGMLFDVYKYADTVYVGGGFGEGIHNVLEPLVFGQMIYIGPKYEKFKEAVDLIELGLVHVVDLTDENDMNDRINPDLLSQYLEANSGATDKIIKHIF